MPVFGYKNHVGIDRAHGFIRRFDRHPCRRPRRRPARRAARPRQHGERGLGRYRLPLGRQPGAARPARAGRRSSSGPSRGASRCRRTSAAATPRGRRCGPGSSTSSPPRSTASGLVVRTIGLARATTKITLANLAYNMRRLVWLEGRATPIRPEAGPHRSGRRHRRRCRQSRRPVCCARRQNLAPQAHPPENPAVISRCPIAELRDEARYLYPRVRAPRLLEWAGLDPRRFGASVAGWRRAYQGGDLRRKV